MKKIRHGHIGILLSGEERRGILKRSWMIIDRFISFRINNSLPLPEEDFPKL